MTQNFTTFRCLMMAVALTISFCSFGQTKVYVANQLSNNITIIDADNNTVIGTLAPFNMPSNLAVTPDGARAVVTFAGSGTASIIDPNDPFNFTNLNCGPGASDVTITPDASKAYIGNATAGTVTVLNMASKTVEATWMGGGNGVALSPDGSTLYSTNKVSGTVVTFNTSSGASATFATGISFPERIAVSHDGERVCIIQNLTNSVTILKSSDGSLEANIPVGVYPTSLSFTPDDKKILVSNTAGNSVSVIDVAALNVASTIVVPGSPIDISVIPSGTKAFTANNGSGKSSVIDIANLSVQQDITCGTFPIAVSYAGEGFTATKDPVADSKWSFENAYPNPFTSQTYFRLQLEESLQLEINVFNANGTLVENIFNGKLAPGAHQFTWLPDQTLSAGLYNVVVTNGEKYAVIQLLKQ